jgi:hypothetical protein
VGRARAAARWLVRRGAERRHRRAAGAWALRGASRRTARNAAGGGGQCRRGGSAQERWATGAEARGTGASAGWRRWRVVQADRALGRSRLGVRRWRASSQEVDAARLVRAGRRRQRVRANSAGADSRQAAAAAQAGA